ncbi:MAG: ribosome-binding factor A [Acidimicrobiales bacterium]
MNQVLREVVAEELERLADTDDRLRLLTVTGVVAEPDQRHAKVLFAQLEIPAEQALVEVRVKLQAAIGSQLRMKRTPRLAFAQDPAILAGNRIEEVLRRVAGAEAPAAAEELRADSAEEPLP